MGVYKAWERLVMAVSVSIDLPPLLPHPLPPTALPSSLRVPVEAVGLGWLGDALTRTKIHAGRGCVNHFTGS